MKEEDVRVWALTNTENREAARVVRSAALPYGAVGGDIAWGVCDRMVTGNKKNNNSMEKIDMRDSISPAAMHAADMSVTAHVEHDLQI